MLAMQVGPKEAGPVQLFLHQGLFLLDIGDAVLHTRGGVEMLLAAALGCLVEVVQPSKGRRARTVRSSGWVGKPRAVLPGATPAERVEVPIAIAREGVSNARYCA